MSGPGAEDPGLLPVGTGPGGAPAHVLARRLNRHTLWVGQSGSGKTYALGVLLEQVLLRTHLPMLVLDPNGDFVRLRQPRPETDATTAEQISDADVTVLGTDPLRPGLTARFSDLSPRSKAAVLRLDPVLDAAEYHALVTSDTAASPLPTDPADLVATLQSRGAAGAALAMRIGNLQVLDWDLWAWGGASATDVVDRRPAATVMDLGGLRHRDESRVAALAVLEHLWARRDERRPVMVVIDEAHNLCPVTPSTPVEQALTDLVVQIAAEGRKYGLWLLLSTQRPGKLHPNAITQCDNLALLRMSSPRDLAEIEDDFGFAPPELLRRSPRFEQGEVLLAGGFVETPTVVRIGPRLTHEGGSDVPVPLRDRLPPAKPATS